MIVISASLPLPRGTGKTIVLVERDGLLRESLSAALRHFGEPHLIGAFETIRDAYEAMAALTPGVLVTDVPCPEDSVGLATLLGFMRDFPGVGIVFLLGKDDALPRELMAAITEGSPAGRCCLRKPGITSLATLVRVIHACADGLIVFDPDIVNPSVGLKTPVPVRSAARDEFKRLFSQRQREVLELMAQGLSNRHIADRLFVAERTVENHIHQIYHRLPDPFRNPGYHLRVAAALSYLGHPLPVEPGGGSSAG